MASIDDAELQGELMIDETKKFISAIEERIGNHWQPVHNPAQPEAIYYDAFGDNHDEDESVLPYGDEMIDAKTRLLVTHSRVHHTFRSTFPF